MEENVRFIEFEDMGQDFLTWEVNIISGEILASYPFQSGVWAGQKLKPETIKIGYKPVFVNDRKLNYKIIAMTKEKQKWQTN